MKRKPWKWWELAALTAGILIFILAVTGAIINV